MTPQANNVDLHVAPFVGVWIEIFYNCLEVKTGDVAPFVGVWIEIILTCDKTNYENRRSLRGSVD